MLVKGALLQLMLLLRLPRLLSKCENCWKVLPHDFMGNNSSHNKKMSTEVKYAPLPADHGKARGDTYPRDPSIKRFPVPQEMLKWDVPYPEYSPTDYTAPSVTCQPEWADVDIRHNDSVTINFNSVDDSVDRTSLTGPYQVVEKLPRNPVGRTGVWGRGLLGRWGPNHAADPIVTRWKVVNGLQVKDIESGLPVLQFIAIQRKDSGEWALPGGMVSPGELVSVTLSREFGEEALNSLEANPSELEHIYQQVAEFFKHGSEVYRGYVDDPRNTDNSWMETVAYNFHDETGMCVARFKLHAGDDAVGVRWMDISHNVKLYASHTHFIKKTVQLHKAHW